MKKLLLYFASSLLILATALWVVTQSAYAQSRPAPVVPGPYAALDLTDFQHFRQQVQPLIAQMADHRVVAMGEGTHGTSEFYTVRLWLTRILVEEHGYTDVAFENDFGDSYNLNQSLRARRPDFESLMRHDLLSIWQNRETEGLLRLLHQRNQQRSRRQPEVRFQGLDNVYVSRDAELVQQLGRSFADANFKDLARQVRQCAASRDSIWENSNRSGFKAEEKFLKLNCTTGYQTACLLESRLQQLACSPQRREALVNLLANLKQRYSAMYFWYAFKKTDVPDRDANMADMAVRIVEAAPERKLIIWAHDGHVARQAVFDGAVGGMGGHIARRLPGQYFVLGTGTATGTFLATDERFDTRTNPMYAAALETPPLELVEAQLAQVPAPAFYFTPALWPREFTSASYRVIGYSPKSGKTTYDQTHRLDELYDAYLFIRDTHAATFIGGVPATAISHR